MAFGTEGIQLKGIRDVQSDGQSQKIPWKVILWSSGIVKCDEISRPSNCPRSVCDCHPAPKPPNPEKKKQKVSEMRRLTKLPSNGGGQPSRRISRFDDIFQLTIIYVVSEIWIHARSLFCPSVCLAVTGEWWIWIESRKILNWLAPALRLLLQIKYMCIFIQNRRKNSLAF